MGQLFMMGFDGTSVNDEIKTMIEDYHLGSIILTAKNQKCAPYFLLPFSPPHTQSRDSMFLFSFSSSWHIKE